MEGYANNLSRNAFTLGVESQRQRRVIRRRTANSRNYHKVNATLRRTVKRKVFCFNLKTETWQEDASCRPVMPSIPMEVVRQLVPKMNEYMFVLHYLLLPYYWIVEAKNDGIVEVTLRLYMCAVMNGEIQSSQQKEWTIACDYFHGTVQAWPMTLLKERTNGWLRLFVYSGLEMFAGVNGASCVEIPSVVTETAISFMQDYAQREFGFRPTCPGSIHGLRHMIAFCHRPLDLNIYLFRNVVGEVFEQMFPRSQRDNYRPLCRFLQLEHPPKSLRKAYQDFPENLVAFVLLRQFGFRDINIIRRFFQREKLFGFHLLGLSYNSETHMLEDVSHQQQNPYLVWLERFCRWFLRHRTERHLAECLRSLAMADSWDQNAADILRMFVYGNIDVNEGVLYPDTLRRLLREGFSLSLHDIMTHELAAIMLRGVQAEQHMPIISFGYTDSEMDYADIIKDYQFVLPKDTDELWIYGQCFHNCVASYRDAVTEKRSLILAMKREEKYIACIEIQQHRVVQALGPCNQKLPVEVCEILRKWADKKKIGYRP